ncbi:hypothetical protein OAM69_04115, partial [bacterium]|nr:hypothetical protein [bacterium]
MSASHLTGEIENSDQSVAYKDAGVAVTFSRGIRTIRHIASFLNVDEVVSPLEAVRRRLSVSCVVVWGRKGNSRQGLQYAKNRALPVLYVEDGWIRTCSANAHSRISYSLLVDDIGVYYDSSVPSSLEQFLNLHDDEFRQNCGTESIAYAARCRQLMVENDITKYNYCVAPNDADLSTDDRPLVLVLDQTVDDASVRLGAMNTDTFIALLDKAVSENSNSRVVVRTHPDVVAGRRRGYLGDRAKALGIEISARADNPIPWLKKASL